MRLPKGITGFRMARDAPLPNVDLRTFTGLTYAAAHMIAAEVVAFAPEVDTIRNFHIAVLPTPKYTRSILCNGVHPVIAFVRDRCESSPPDFIDAPNLRRVYEQTGQFRVLKQSDLNSYPHANMLAELGKAEIAQIHFWKPQRIGDIVFNHWD